ncbi:hypothetical protein U27_06201 [Candidatus Vecturithrix granuli]|uniref:Uncharacterized protein n=1 Tax=Vecturithrix granuli TaxID=1499967 RepID=A0A081C3R9_VECG1|nr:hypothetical protein U27_06201 [Candidatus Vecturithrix granuli]
MKKCYEAGIDPKSPKAPRSIEDGVERFFPDWKNWDLSSFRKAQAEEIQILADGPKLIPSLIVYDNGEGQHPEDFEGTFLSLLRGNKNEIHFVQGKYNMGGTGAIVFCGKKRYHLIGSRRFDGTGKFGFTLIRKHPLSRQEQQTKKNTWYEYLKINKQIPGFDITELDLGLYHRKFTTGTLIKLYSYDLPTGARSVISRDLNQSINEYLFVPALPIYTIDKKERYPQDRALERELYGLKRRLEQDDSKYIEDFFSESYQDQKIGGMKVTCYVFKPKIEDKSIKESRESIRREFFKNDMSVLFSDNGQVHAHYTSEFITRSLQFPLLKNHLLIHVDCTNMHLEFRNELFMASRDRLKGGDEARYLREKLANVLKRSKLKEINKHRKEAITVEGGEAQDLLKSLTKNLPLNEDLLKLLSQTFKLEQKKKEPPKTHEKKHERAQEEKEPFVGKRFPTYLRLTRHTDDAKPIAQIPIGGERTIRLLTDVENQYFDRIEDPGEFEVALLNIKRNEVTGGDQAGTPREISEVFNVVKTSPNNGVIKVLLNPTDVVQVGDAVEIQASLAGAGETFEEIFWVKISEPEQKPEPKKEKEVEDDRLGLPKHILVYKEARENVITWEKMESEGIEMEWKTVMHPYIEGETLESIYINMDSTVLKNYKSKLKSEEQYQLADKRYISTVYFHTLFLYSINKNRQYAMKCLEGEDEKEVDLTEYLKDVFESYYSAFLLNFEISELIESLDV